MKRLLPLLPLLLATLGGGCGTHATPKAPPAPWPTFDAASATNAYALVEGLVQFSPRDAGSEGAAYASQWIAGKLRAAGLTPRADVWRERSGSRPDVQFCNVYADLPGETDTLLVLGSHYDTKPGIGPGFQGANDGGSSTGILLEAARLLVASGIRPRHTIRFAFFDGEECHAAYTPEDGLQGSRRMATQLAADRANRDVAAAIVIDMVGDELLHLELPRNVSPWMATIVLKTSAAIDRRLDCGGDAVVRIADSYVIDDHWPFIERGIPAIDIIDLDYGPVPGSHAYWHSEEDRLDKISVRSLGIVGQILLSVVEKVDQREQSNSARD